MSPDWSDPEYRAALKARIAAYLAFSRAAGENPHKRDDPEFMAYYETEVAPLRVSYWEAADALRAETARVIRESEEA